VSAQAAITAPKASTSAPRQQARSAASVRDAATHEPERRRVGVGTTRSPERFASIPTLPPDATAGASTTGGPLLYLARKCAACSCSACAEEDEELALHRKPLPGIGRDDPLAESEQMPSRSERLVREALLHSSGEPLSPAVRLDMERAYGVDFGNVRIHADSLARESSAAVSAEAYTIGQAIYFAAGRYQPHTSAGRELLAHELAHVVQNRHASAPVAARRGSLQVSAPHDVAEAEADAAARAVAAGRTFEVRGSGSSALHRKGKLDELVDWGKTTAHEAGSAVASGAQKVAHFTGEQLMKLVRAVAPGLAAIIDEGPVNFAKRKVSEALDAHLPAALGGFSLGDLVQGVGSFIGAAKGFVTGLARGEESACARFANFMHTLTDVIGKLIDNPIIDAVTGVLGKASDFVTKVLKVIGEPLFDGLKQYVSGTWSALKKVASTVSGWFSRAKAELGELWTQLMTALGFDGSSEDGVWSWIKTQAAKVWDKLKAAVAPAIAPLKKIASVVGLLTPFGQIHAIVKYGPKVVAVAQWIWQNGLSPEKIRDAPEDIRGMLESIGGNVNGFRDRLKEGLNWLSDKLASLGEAVLEAASTVSGLPLVSFAHDLLNDAREKLKKAVADVQRGAEQTLTRLEETAAKVDKFVEPYKGVISTLIIAIAAPPTIPVLLAGWAWGKIPKCVKIPILDFVLDIAIKEAGKIPALPTFGPLWALLKPGVLAFLETLRKAPDATKENVSNRIARILSGSNPDFLIAFIKGFALGIWDGIKDPFSAIWTVMEGLDKATEYLLSLSGLSEEPARPAVPTVNPASPARAPAPTPAAAATATPATAPAPAAPVAAAGPQGAQSRGAAAVPPQAGKETGGLDADGLAALKASAAETARAIGPDVDTVKGNFWDAVQDYFNGGSMTFDDLVQKLSEAWQSAQAKITEGGAWLAKELLSFFNRKPEDNAAESELGDKIGWLTGTVVFQLLLDALTAGTWTEADSILTGIAKFINWPMEALGEAFKLLKSLGKYLLDGLKKLGGAIKEAASGAFRTVSKAIGHIGEKVLAFGEEMFGKFGGKAARAEAKEIRALGKEAGSLTEREGAKASAEAALEESKGAAQKLEKHAGGGPEAKTGVAEPGEPVKGSEAQGAEAKKGEPHEGGEHGPEESAQKQAQLAAAEAEAKAIMTSDSAIGIPVPALVAELMLLKLQFSWIKSFEAQPKGNGHYTIHLLASDHVLGDYNAKLEEDIRKRLASLEDSPLAERYLIDTGRVDRLAHIAETAKKDAKAAEQMLRELENDVKRAGGDLRPDVVNDAAKGGHVKPADEGFAELPDERPSDLFNPSQAERDAKEAALERGNTFNAEREGQYQHSEVAIVKPPGSPGSGRYYFLDSYNEGQAIVSRKFPVGQALDREIAIKNIVELAEKYPQGAVIAQTAGNLRKGVAVPGQVRRLQGRPILEVPVLLKDVEEDILQFAERQGVTIRDVEGHIY
jgi:hypothetical protein